MALFICPNWHFTYPSATLIETYEYDYLGNRTAKTSNDARTEYTTDLSTGYSQVLKSTTGSDSVFYTRGFELISRQKGSSASYYIYDGGLSVRALTNEVGAITDTLVFDAFGNETTKTDSTDNSYGFQGEEKDETGLYYLRARYMDPSTGTFTSMDTYGGSLSDPMSLHKYLFANANPVKYSDPSGHFSLVEFELSEAIDEILMSSLSFGMAYIGAVADDSTINDGDKIAGYLVALELGALFPFGVALLYMFLPILVVGLILATLSLVLTGVSISTESSNPVVSALSKITAGACWAAALGSLGRVFAGNAQKSDELIHVKADTDYTRKQKYTDPKYQKSDGTPDWENYASNYGAVPGSEKTTTLEVGTLFDRYGLHNGKYGAEYMTPYEQRALPYVEDDYFYEVYRVIKPISNVTKSTVSASFGCPGGGVQYKLPYNIQYLLDNGYIEVVYKGF